MTEDAPNIGEASTPEICTIFLAIVAVIAGLLSMGTSFVDPSVGYSTVAIAFGLASIAFAILTVGRQLSEKD